jgi:signal transduction histidine kinase
MRLAPSGGDGAPAAFVIPALVAGMFTAGLLALEAYRAATYHRRSTESVLRDYATLAAGEMIRRSANELGYYGYYPLATALERVARDPRGPDARTLSDALHADEAVRRASSLLQTAFTVDAESSVRPWRGPLDPEVAAWVSSHSADAARRQGGYTVLHGLVAGRPHTFVLGSVAGRRAMFGFEVALPALSEWLGRAFGRGPVLPPSLGAGGVTNSAVSLVVVDHAGIERFRSLAREWPELRVEVPFGDAYDGVLLGSRVRVSLDPEAADRLVIGGLPRSRLPALLAVLATTFGLLLAALLQLRRERELQRMRSEFVSSVSHELRTPLTQIRMFAETLLLERVRSADERRRALEIVDKEARRLTHLVENLLQFSRSERRTTEIVLEDRELGSFVREVVDGFRPILARSEVGLDLEIEEGVNAPVDAEALRQVLLNLLDNAVKYGPPRQRVRLTVGRATDGARIAVEDQGPGVPGRDRERVFERFHRLARDRTRVAGTGIGLSVVREIVARHRGRCRVEDAASGGARFVVELPGAARPGRDPSPQAGAS